jgi:hypothetical protein
MYSYPNKSIDKPQIISNVIMFCPHLYIWYKFLKQALLMKLLKIPLFFSAKSQNFIFCHQLAYCCGQLGSLTKKMLKLKSI